LRNILKNIKSFLRNQSKIRILFWVGSLIIVSVLGINYFFHIIEEPKTDNIYGIPNSQIAKTIIKMDTLYTKSSVIQSNSEIISFLEELITIDSNELTTQESIKMQLRLFYVAVFTVLISFLFRDRTKKYIPVILIIVIASMYGLEIHQLDMFKRSIAAYHIRAEAIENFININPNINTRYTLDFSFLQRSMKKHLIIV
jgi:hypothetical protein